MYVKTNCPYCEKGSFHNITATITEAKQSTKLKKIEVSDTLKEEDLILIVSKFISQNMQKGVSSEDLKCVLNECLGISPQFAKDLILKLNIECKCAV
jgi:hypothetical protein